MRRGPTRKPPHPLFQDEDIEIEDGGDRQDEYIDDDDLNPREGDEDVPSDEDDLEEEEAAGPHR
ncbi:MAG: hypothetical protein DME16_07455 [Candidatus Rokuibacteriota bacterium]|nr:MAG: hypothetical protein DME16_07455 [Candidatus Rokubacteria bacterium]